MRVSKVKKSQQLRTQTPIPRGRSSKQNTWIERSKIYDFEIMFANMRRPYVQNQLHRVPKGMRILHSPNPLQRIEPSLHVQNFRLLLAQNSLKSFTATFPASSAEGNCPESPPASKTNLHLKGLLDKWPSHCRSCFVDPPVRSPKRSCEASAPVRTSSSTALTLVEILKAGILRPAPHQINL